MGMQNKDSADDLEVIKQDKKKHVNKDVKYSKAFQVSILCSILLFDNSHITVLMITVLMLDLEVTFILQNTSVPNLCKLG